MIQKVNGSTQNLMGLDKCTFISRTSPPSPPQDQSDISLWDYIAIAVTRYCPQLNLTAPNALGDIYFDGDYFGESGFSTATYYDLRGLVASYLSRRTSISLNHFIWTEYSVTLLQTRYPSPNYVSDTATQEDLFSNKKVNFINLLGQIASNICNESTQSDVAAKAVLDNVIDDGVSLKFLNNSSQGNEGIHYMALGIDINNDGQIELWDKVSSSGTNAANFKVDAELQIDTPIKDLPNGSQITLMIADKPNVAEAYLEGSLLSRSDKILNKVDFVDSLLNPVDIDSIPQTGVQLSNGKVTKLQEDLADFMLNKGFNSILG